MEEPDHILLFVFQVVRVWCFRCEKGIECELCAEAEAGDEAIEAVGVEKVGGDREVLLEIRPLFLGERSGQFGLEVALLLRELLHSATRADGALARR